MSSGLAQKIALAVLLSALLAGCHSGGQRAVPIGEAFVGPAILKIRSDIPLDSAAVATVKHGDRLAILQRRRKFLRVRTPSGAEGWTEERQLLAASDMDNLRQLAARAAKMPSQGVGTAVTDVRVHTQPSAQSPSFLLLKENEKFDVLAELVLPRTDVPRAPLIPPAPKKAKAASKKPAREPRVPPVPMPKPPAPPSNWLDLSKTEIPSEDMPEEPEVPAKPVPTDHWSLVRTANGQTGWALTRVVRMAIPDEVAQYAEGHRIVSYFPLGEVRDGDQVKKIWLWTTIHGGGPYDFDSFRVFVWSLRHHRYETAYIERSVQGHAPVLLEQVELAGTKARGGANAAKYPGFSICLTGKDGQLHRREYALLENTVRYAGERGCEPPTTFEMAKPAAPPTGVAPNPEAAKPSAPSLLDRVKNRLRAMVRKR